ncbi:MAG: glycosyltransferase family 2 protein [Candidatus Omnitrophica bacterium]|nr:glycosyltransferase family 2 protein [Candidatus Omnitrophota bacterium]MDD5655165.1 glycosyltransferase family 2 protein [Candidatus Omnitrophota bacterium]
MKICAIIPVYNESKAIGELVTEVRKQNIDVLVIDDGSKDNSADIARNNGAIVLKNITNQGKGASLLQGLNYVLNNNFDAAILMDGDGQHLPQDIPAFIQKSRENGAALVLGNRMQDTKNMPPVRYLTNKTMSWLISKITGKNIPDSQCGFRFITKDLIDKLKFTTRHYETESEMIIQAAHAGYKIDSIAVKTVYRGEKSQINPILDTLRFFLFIIRHIR